MLLKINKIIEKEDGSADIDFEADEEFIAWFKQKHKLKRWSQKRFQKWAHKMLKKTMGKNKETDSDIKEDTI